MVINEEVDIDTERIQMKELDTTIKHLKNNKAPGPDKCTTELFKLLSRDTQKDATPYPKPDLGRRRSTRIFLGRV